MTKIAHPFEAARPNAPRCEHLTAEDTVCGRPRAEHRSTLMGDGRSVRRPVHPRRTEVYQATTQVPGVDVAVDEAGCLVLHVAHAGAHTITNLDSLIADLELARNHAKRFAQHPEFYAAGRDPVLPSAPRPAAAGGTP